MKTKFTLLPLSIFAILILGILNMQCVNVGFAGIKGNGKVTSQNRIVDEFNGINLSGVFNLVLTQGNEQSVKIETDENIQQYIKTSVKNNVLEVSTKKEIDGFEKMNVYITVKELNSIESSGATKVTSENSFKSKKFKLDISGTSVVKLNIETEEMNTDLSGAASIELKGFAASHIVDLSGAGNLVADKFETSKTVIDLSGAGSARINAKKEIRGQISGIGNINYVNDPEIKDINVSGMGAFNKIN